MDRGNILGLVLSTILVSGTVATPTAYAGSYCTLSGCQVWETVTPGWGGAGGGGGSFDNTTTYGPQDPQLICAGLMENPAPNCNANNPPPLIQNGCGSASVDVPDFLVSFTNPAAAATYGGIFTEACNKHDACYGSAGLLKNFCDTDLRNNMIATAKAILGANYPLFQSDVEGQANAYAAGLQWGPIATFISGPAYDAAQAEGNCRSWSGAVRFSCK